MVEFYKNEFGFDIKIDCQIPMYTSEEIIEIEKNYEWFCHFYKVKYCLFVNDVWSVKFLENFIKSTPHFIEVFLFLLINKIDQLKEQEKKGLNLEDYITLYRKYNQIWL